MTRMDYTKIVGSVLVALLVATAIGQFADLLTATDKTMATVAVVTPRAIGDEPQAQEADVAEGAAAPAEDRPAGADSGPQPFTVLLAAADAEAGARRAAARCGACHTFDQGGANKVGPNLWNVVGRDKGSVDGFRYSNALKEVDGHWSVEDLAAFLEKPKQFLKGTRMAFPGVRDAKDRAAIISFLRTRADEPVPLPKD